MTKEKAEEAAKQIVDLVWLASRDSYSTVSSCEERASDIILSVCNKKEGNPFGYNCAVCGESIDDSQATDHTDEGLAHEECLSETPTPQGQVSKETGILGDEHSECLGDLTARFERLKDSASHLRDTANFILDLLYDQRMPSVGHEELLRHAIKKFDAMHGLSTKRNNLQR